MPTKSPFRLTTDNLAVSPCSSPSFTLAEALREYSALGYRKFELFSAWAASRVSLEEDPQVYLALAREYGMSFTSMHLLAVENNVAEGVALAIAGARLAAALGVRVVLYKATSKESYIAGARAFLDGIEGLEVIPVLQNHVGTPITTLADFLEVRAGINDSRMKSLLEVGMFHMVGTKWPEAYEALAGTIELVHIKDQIGTDKVPFGTGEVDLRGLFARLQQDGYTGEIVIEMEVDRNDQPRTLQLLREAREHCAGLLAQI